jgi:hypothetical protein
MNSDKGQNKEDKVLRAPESGALNFQTYLKRTYVEFTSTLKVNVSQKQFI